MERDGSKRHCGDDRAYVRFKEVCAHARNVSYIVAYVVGNDGGVARVIFGDASFYFAYQVGTDVSSFSINASAHAREQGNRAGAQGEAVNHAHQNAKVGHTTNGAKRHVQRADAKEPQPYHRHAHDGTAGESDRQSLVSAKARRSCRAHVSARSHGHANKASQHRA